MESFKCSTGYFMNLSKGDYNMGLLDDNYKSARIPNDSPNFSSPLILWVSKTLILIRLLYKIAIFDACFTPYTWLDRQLNNLS